MTIFMAALLLASIPLAVDAREVIEPQEQIKPQEETKPQEQSKIIYKFDIKKMIAAPIWRTTKKSFEEAREKGADYIIIHMNTYGGQVDFADSIDRKSVV